MSDSVYAVIAYIARYWFAFLVVIIVWRAIVWLQKDADQKARTRMKLPDAGFIGEWVVLSPSGEMAEGDTLSAPRDGLMGSARGCDVRLRCEDVPARAARFFLMRDGLHLLPKKRWLLDVDGEPVLHEAVLRHGATVTIGEITIQLRLFAGILLEGEKVVSRAKRSGMEEMETDEPVAQAPPGGQLPTPALYIRKKVTKKRGTSSGK